MDEKDVMIQKLEEEVESLWRFKEYFDELYGTGLTVLNWHLNGDEEPFDTFYEAACEEM